MRTIKAIREEKASLSDHVDAIIALAESEERAISAEEQKEIDAIVGVGTRGAADYKPGKIDALNSEEDRVQNFARIKAELAGSRAGEERPQNGSGTPKITVPAKARNVKRMKAFKSPEDAYASGQWVLATIGRRESSMQWCKDHGIPVIRDAMTTGDNTLGGFLVPDGFESAVIDLRESYGVFRQESHIVQMPSDTHTVPRRAGGLTAYFVGDNTEITGSDKRWDAITLTARKLGVLSKYSSEIAEDAVISVADDLATEIAYAFAVKEDACGFNGDGTSTYGGITGIKNALAAGSVYTAATGNTAFSTLDLDDFEGMIAKLPQYPGIMPKWFIHSAGWAASMLRLAEAAGGNTTANIAGGMTKMFLGYPVVFVQSMNSTLTAQTSTSGLCYFGDLSMGTTMGTRRGVSIATSSDRYFELDQLAIKGTERFDINVHEVGTASAAGPIIGLTTPGA